MKQNIWTSERQTPGSARFGHRDAHARAVIKPPLNRPASPDAPGITFPTSPTSPPAR